MVSSGWLMLRSKDCVTGSVATWNRRWVEVEVGRLGIYTKPSSEGGELQSQYVLKPGTEVHAIAKRLEAPKLDNARLGGKDRLGQRWCFVTIFEDGPPVYMQAVNGDQQTQWVDSISAAVCASDSAPEEVYNNIITEVVDGLMPRIVDEDGSEI